MKSKILVFTEYYLPGYLAGGPIRSIANIIQCLGFEFDWYVITSDRDINSKVPYEGIVPNCWRKFGSVQIYYISPDRASFVNFIKLINSVDPDVIYLNSFFSRKYSLLPILANKLGFIDNASIILAPRGEFSVGAIAIKKFRKLLYIYLARFFGMYNVVWHASTNLEAIDIRRYFLDKSFYVLKNIYIAMDIANINTVKYLNSSKNNFSGLDRCIKICFLSRISRKKNLKFALTVLGSVSSSIGIVFDIYGPIEDGGYWAECQEIILKLPIGITVRYIGAIKNEDVTSTISCYNLFFFPTLGENFGHVFLEAWSAGLPVLTSDQTPWRGLAETGVGWDLSLEDVNGFSLAIESVSGWSDEHRKLVQAKCIAFAISHSCSDEIVQANIEMFSGVARVKKMT